MGPALCSVSLDMVYVTLHRGCNAATGKRTVGHLALPMKLEISWLRCRGSPASSDRAARLIMVHVPSRLVLCAQHQQKTHRGINICLKNVSLTLGGTSPTSEKPVTSPISPALESEENDPHSKRPVVWYIQRR